LLLERVQRNDTVLVQSIEEHLMATVHSKTHKSDGVAVAAQHHAADTKVYNGSAHIEESAHGTDLLARGKDVLSAEVGGVATAAVIGIGAALIEVELLPGILIGAGAILLGKMFPEIGSLARPMLKGVVRAGLSASQKLREVVAEANEEVHDLVAEVKHEREREHTLPAKHVEPAQDPEATAAQAAH
jgi:hypothetical protein